MSPKAFFISIAVLLSSAFCVFAQESAHLKFKGIPIEGNYKAFAQKLVQKGFEQLQSTNDGIVLKGTFMATPGVIIAIYPDPTSKVVYMVMAMIETDDSWANIERKYFDIIETYTEKYGEPTEHVEEFTADVHDSDSWRKISLQDGQCNYKTIWETEGGRIVIYPLYFNFNYYITCAYIDNLNREAVHQTIIDDI